MYNNLKLLVPPQVYSMYLSVTICMCVCVVVENCFGSFLFMRCKH